MYLAQNRCESSFRHDETVDTLTIAQFVVDQRIWHPYDPLYLVQS